MARRRYTKEVRTVIIESLLIIIAISGFVTAYQLGYAVGIDNARKLCTVPQPPMGKALLVVFYRFSNDTMKTASTRVVLLGDENITLVLNGVTYVKVYLFAYCTIHYSVDVYFGKKIHSVYGVLSPGNFTALYRFLNGCSTIYMPTEMVDIPKCADKIVVSVQEINSTVTVILEY